MSQIYRKKSNLVAISLFLFILGLAMTLSIFVGKGEQLPFDIWSGVIFHDVVGKLFHYITDLGSRRVVIVFTLLIVGFLLVKRAWLAASMMFLGVYFGNELNEAIKGIVKRDRPSSIESIHDAGYSFPSGHAMVAVICYSLAAYFVTRYIQSETFKLLISISTFILVFFIGITRYILSAHYLTDVIGGFLFGIVFVMVWIALHRVLSTLRLFSPPRDREENIL
ncbi:phosphatase PAP2 family protein [Pontibacillus yanchengensis]|uniref:Phosphatidic acid phosphatase type 2/haloperoxidase domain-containing protein n=1 Tax=Pontibacillus yanchengensis Y32 TaxID=1385514 RepID=A0A0A2T6Z0_9BACI|nr:phosphatase PAP2 family protein [Pontibacillus yanchengensis]KGP71577.1 hypothetical protein N782_18125 [Pontibacillus yanchengensis Y32]